MESALSKIVLLAALIGFSNCGSEPKSMESAATETINPENITLTTLKLHNLDGSQMDLTGLAGKRVFVNFWATWCKPCLAEMPSISRATETLAGDNIVFLAASDEKLDRIVNFNEKNGYKFDIVATQADLSLLEIYALPATFIFDEQGNLVFKETGAREWDSEDNIQLIKETQKL